MSSLIILSVFLPFLGAFACLFAGKKSDDARDILADVLTIAEFLILLVLFLTKGAQTGEGEVFKAAVPAVCGFGLHFMLDGFRLIYGLVAVFMWMIATICSREYFHGHHNRTRFYLFLLLTEGATMGVFLSGDLYTTFIFFEIMSFTSFVWVAQEENAASLRAAGTYLAIAVIGGLVMLMGIFMTWNIFGTLDLHEIFEAMEEMERTPELYAAGICMLVGFGAKAGAFPLHIWLPKAHPVAPAPASALLSGILTKTGIYGVLLLCCNFFMHDHTWGVLILTIGVLTMFGGALLAVFSIDLKRTLACSSLSQIGFIMVGAGMMGLLGEENGLACHGTILHMMNHSMIKLVLFLAAGIIYHNTHSLDLNKIRGFGRKKPLIMGIFLVGALTIGGIPLFGGYISKTLLHESIVEYHHGGAIMKVVEWIFLVSGGMTVAYMTKLFVAIFVEENEDKALQKKYDSKKNYMNAESTVALTAAAVVLLVWGVCSGFFMEKAAELTEHFFHLEEEVEKVHFFEWKCLSGACISIAIGAVLYVCIRLFLMRETKKGGKEYINAWPKWWDVEDMIYRPILMVFLPGVCGFLCSILDHMMDTLAVILPNLGAFCARVLDRLIDVGVVGLRKTVYADSPLPHEREEGTVFSDLCAGAVSFFRRDGKERRHAYAMKAEERKATRRIVEKSFSFGLMMATLGFIIVFVYMIWFA